MDKYIESIDSAVAVHLRRNGITQADMAKQLGMSENTLSWKRRGRNEFTLTEVVNIANLCGVTVDELIGVN